MGHQESTDRQVVVITGGGTGIGAAVAERYAAEDASVVVLGRRQKPLDEISSRTGAIPLVADAADSASARAAIERIVDLLGHIDVLVLSAGGHGFSEVIETGDADWKRAFDANLTTAFVMAREALPALMRHKGNAQTSQIVIVSSLAGLFAGPAVAGYTASKHALIGLTRSLARDYSRKGVRVNAVCPGWVRTPMADEEMDELALRGGSVVDRESGYALVSKHIPLGRVAEPSEIASIIRFLGSEDSSYLSGSVLVADGGAHIVDLPTIAFDR